MSRKRPAPTPAILAFLNVPLDRDNWAARSLSLLQSEGALSRLPKRGDEDAALARFTLKGGRLTFGNLAYLHGRLTEIFAEIAARGRFTPRHTELLNAALGQARGLRFRLERPLTGAADPAGALLLRPQTFDLDVLLHYAAARFLSGLDPGRLGRCPHCRRFFVRETARRKRFCRESCRMRFHNRSRTETGRQALYMRRRRERLRGGGGARSR